MGVYHGDGRCNLLSARELSFLDYQTTVLKGGKYCKLWKEYKKGILYHIATWNSRAGLYEIPISCVKPKNLPGTGPPSLPTDYAMYDNNPNNAPNASSCVCMSCF